MKRLAYSLKAIREKISTKDHIIYLLFGLGTDYDAIISVITAKSRALTL